MPWPDGMPRRASIANFGVGGSNTHAILEDPTSYFASLHSKQDWLCGPTDLPSTVSDSDSDFLLVDANPTNGPPATAKYLLVFSNRDRQCLNEYLTESFAPYLQRADSDKHMPSLAYTLCERRSHFSWRTCVVADSVESVLQSTASFSHNTRRVSSASTKVAFVFTGQGAQWARMGYELIGRFPVFSQYIQRADKQLRALGASWDIYGTILAYTYPPIVTNLLIIIPRIRGTSKRQWYHQAGPSILEFPCDRDSSNSVDEVAGFLGNITSWGDWPF